MVRIGKIQFGSILVGGNYYHSDVYITPLEEVERRKTNHKIILKELKRFENVNQIVIGTGLSGNCKISEDAKLYAKRKGIRLIIDKTPKAVKKFNKLRGNKAAIMHITC